MATQSCNFASTIHTPFTPSGIWTWAREARRHLRTLRSRLEMQQTTSRNSFSTIFSIFQEHLDSLEQLDLACLPCFDMLSDEEHAQTARPGHRACRRTRH